MKELSLILEKYPDRICELMDTANRYQSMNLDRQYTVAFSLEENKAYLIDQKKGETCEQFSHFGHDWLALKTYASEYNSREEQHQALSDYMQAKIDVETPKEAIERILGRLSFADRSTFQNMNNEHPEWGDNERLDFILRSFPPIEYTPKDILSQQELVYKTYGIKDDFEELLNAAKAVKVCDERDKQQVSEMLEQFSPSIYVELDPSFFSQDNLSQLWERFERRETGFSSFEEYAEHRAKQALQEFVVQREDKHMTSNMAALNAYLRDNADSDVVQKYNCLRDVHGYVPHNFFELAQGKVTTMDEISLIKAVQSKVEAFMEGNDHSLDVKPKRDEVVSRD